METDMLIDIFTPDCLLITLKGLDRVTLYSHREEMKEISLDKSEPKFVSRVINISS